MPSTDLANVEPDSWRADTLTLDAVPAKPNEEDVCSPDYYEILRINSRADEDTIERVYGTLADRFHPDNPSTGDPDTFLRLKEAYETLSNPARRAKYDVLREQTGGPARFWLRGRQFFDGVRGGQNRRLAILCLLYRKRISTHESPGLTVLELEQLTGCTREEVTSALWYLCEKGWGMVGEFTAYSITVDGFDVVESKLEDHLEFRALATLRYYGMPAEPDDPALGEPRFAETDTLPLDIEPGAPIDGDAFISDHYEILGIGPQADEEVIERVYRTLAGRFHPDNPTTGNAKAFQRIREAYDTLSDQARRKEYDASRERTKHSTRFRLRGREFFDGIRGEQLRRLAVLCLLYRQAESESRGLTVLDLEQLTGCTREELGSSLWYLRQKKWAKCGEFTEYSITAAGFDVVENKLEEGSARSRARFNSADTQRNVVEYRQITAAEPPQAPISNAVAPENQNPHRDVESKRTDIKAEEPSEDAEVALVPIAIEEAPGNAAQGTRVGERAEAQQGEAVGSWAWLYPEDTGDTEFEISNQASTAHPAEQSQANAPDKNAEAAPAPIPIEAQRPRVARPFCASSSEAQRPPIAAPGGPETLPQQPRVARPFCASSSEAASGTTEQITRFEDRAEVQKRGAADSTAGLVPEDIHDNESLSPHASAARPAAPSEPEVKVAPQSPGVSGMNDQKDAIAAQAVGNAVGGAKRVIFSMGGKGGVGKTSVMTGLAEWFEENRIPVTLLDLDTENKAKGSLAHFFAGRVPKINIHTPAGLDAFVDILADDAPAILADMGAGAGQITHDWFHKMYPDVSEAGVVFTAVGVVTSDPASVESVLNWGEALQDRVAYVIVENNLTEHTDFTYWRDGEQAEEFRKRFRPAIIQLDYRLADLENAARNHGVTLGRVAGRTVRAPELQKASLVMRAQSYRRRMFAEFDKVKDLLLP